MTIKTPDGSCDAAFIHPATGAHPGVLIWPDAFGLRPSMRDIGRRLAAEGYSVLVPNPFYRVAKAPVFETAANVNFSDPATRAKLGPLMGSVNAAGAAEKDAAAYVAFLDAQPQVDKAQEDRHAGLLHGRRARDADGRGAARRGSAPARRSTAAAWSPTSPDSPHLLAPKIKARMYFGVAPNDDQRQPDAKDKLKEAFAAAKVPAEVEVYPAQPRLVRGRHADRRRRADLQHGRRRTRLGQAAGAVQGGSRLAVMSQ